jgi:hypothetical protein
VKHWRAIYPDDADHIISWLAWRVQRPEVKINHALVLGGAPKIGKQFYEPCKNWGMRGAVFQFILRPNPPILFVRARKIGSRSGSYVRFVDLVNEPALDSGPREDAHESALSSDL